MGMLIETIFSLLYDVLISRFETEQLFLKSNFRIQILFSIFPHLENKCDDKQIIRHVIFKLEFRIYKKLVHSSGF